MVRPRDHRDQLAAVYDRYRHTTPGGLARSLPLWDDLLVDWEDSREGGTPWFCFLHPDGYPLYRYHRGATKTVRVEEFTAALRGRTYRAELDTVIEVDDEFRSEGGRFALRIHDGRTHCERTDAAAEFTMGLDVLGSLYLGGHQATVLAAANRIRGGTPEAPARLDAAFRSDAPAQIGLHF